MKMKRILALTLAAWMVCSTAVRAEGTAPKELFTSEPVYGESVACIKEEQPAPEPPIDYIKIDTNGMPPEDVKIVAGERSFNFYAGDTIHLPHADSFIAIAKGDSSRRKAVFAMNTTVNQAVADKYPHASLMFLNGNGGALGKGATMHIAAGGRRHLYRFVALDHNIKGEWDLSSTYNAEQDTFIFPAETLDSYILSDADLTDENNEFYFTWLPADMVNSKTNNFADFLTETYSNRFAVLTYGIKMQKMAKPVTFRKTVWVVPESPRQVDMKRMRVYILDETRNKLVRMPDAKPAYDTRKKELSFTSDYRGMFVITDSGWVHR